MLLFAIMLSPALFDSPGPKRHPLYLGEKKIAGTSGLGNRSALRSAVTNTLTPPVQRLNELSTCT